MKHSKGQRIDGIFLLDKPIGYTSNAALQKIKRLFDAKKAGHTGSLDPLATGMLPICFGEATKFSQFLLDADKSYAVTIKLGEKTTTGDAEGDVIATKPVPALTEKHVQTVLTQFRGQISQIPPMFSALKHQGKPLYKLARQGIEIERAARNVMIYELNLEQYTTDTITFNVRCSKGTYIRTLAEDIGEVLGCGAYVQKLRRTAVTPYEQDKMFTLEMLEELARNGGNSALTQMLLPLESSVKSLPEINLTTSSAFYFRRGQAVTSPVGVPLGLVRIYAVDEFIGVGEVLDDRRIVPCRLVA